MQMDQNERIERIERGRNAAITHGFISQPIEEAERNIILRLVAQYRSGTASHDAILGGIAEIAALHNLLAFLKNTQQKAHIAEETEYK